MISCCVFLSSELIYIVFKQSCEFQLAKRQPQLLARLYMAYIFSPVAQQHLNRKHTGLVILQQKHIFMSCLSMHHFPLLLQWSSEANIANMNYALFIAIMIQNMCLNCCSDINILVLVIKMECWGGGTLHLSYKKTVKRD